MAYVYKDTAHGRRYLAPNGKTMRWVIRRDEATDMKNSRARSLAKEYRGIVSSEQEELSK